MSHLLRFGSILILTLIVGFVGYIYYLGATDPFARDEILVDGQWVGLRSYDDTIDPGHIRVVTSPLPYGESFTLTGEAQSTWFYGGTINAELFTADGMSLWRDVALTEEDTSYDVVAPFFIDIVVQESYEGEAVLVLQPGTEADEPSPFVYTTTLQLVQEEIAPEDIY